MEIIIVAFIAGVVGPTVLAILTGRQARAMKAEDYTRQVEKEERDRARQDEVADRAQLAADDLKAAQEETIRRTAEVARLAAESDKATKAQLGEIKIVADQTHGLVNSQMDEQKRIQLAGSRRELVGLEELRDLRLSLGQKPSTEAEIAIDAVRQTITDLELEVAERARRLDIAEEKAEQSTSSLESRKGGE